MKKIRPILILLLAVFALIPLSARANNGDFAGGVAIGSGYAGTAAAPSNGLIVQGNVGVGTTSVTDALDLAGALGLTTSASPPSNGMYLSGTNTLAFTTSGATALTITTTGSVGIGTTSPGTALDINGALTERGIAAPPLSSSGQGIIYFDSTAKQFEMSQNGGAYAPLGGGSGSGGGGGFVNKIRNGAMLVSQRISANTSTSLTTTDAYWIDGWLYHVTGAAVTGYWQNTAFTAATGDNPAYLPGYMEIKGASSNTGISIYQRIESYDAMPLAGQTVTVQFQFYNNSGASITPTFQTCYASAQDNFSTCTADIAATNLQSCSNGATCTEAYTFSASANAVNGYQVRFNFGAMTSSSDIIEMSGFDVRTTPGGVTGVNAAPPTIEIPTIAAEVARNQRYYLQRGGHVTYECIANSGFINNTTTAYVTLFYPVQMRAIPTLNNSAIGDLGLTNTTGGILVATNLSLNSLQTTANSANFIVTVGSGLTTGQAVTFLTNGTTSGWVSLSAEL